MRIFILLLLQVISGCTTVASSNQMTLGGDSKQKADARVAVGMEYLRLGHLDKAGQNFELAIEHAPDYYLSRLSQALYYQHVGSTSSAQALYDQLIQTDLTEPAVVSSYATFLCQQNKFSQAQHWYRQSILNVHALQRASNYQSAALCALKDNDYPLAETYLNQALEHQPERKELWFYLIEMYLNTNQTEKAKNRLANFEQRFGSNAATKNLRLKINQ